MRVILTLLAFLSMSGMSAQTTTAIEVPFEFYRNQIILQAIIDGKGPFSMLLDTGTDPSAIDLATARDIGLKLPARGHSVSGGGTSPNNGYETKLPAVAIAGLTAKNVSAVALDLAKLSEELGRPANGVLGHSLLNGRTVQIDYVKRIVRFYDRPLFDGRAKQDVLANRTILRFRHDGSILIDDVLVNGKKVTASIDTGSTDAFQLTPAAASLLGLEEQARSGQPAPSVGYNGMSENTRGKVDSIKIGLLNLDSPVVTFFPKGAGHDKESWGLNVGNDFFKGFILTIDYRSRILVLDRQINP
jgi:predicted aspartyl protease